MRTQIKTVHLHCPIDTSTWPFPPLFFSQVISAEVSALEPEVTRVTNDGNNLLRSENLDGEKKDKLVKDIRDIEETYEDLKKYSVGEVKR